MKNLILSVGLISLSVAASAQESENDKFTLSAVSLNTGIQYFSYNSSNELEKFRTLAPNSMFLKNDFSTYNTNSYSTTDGSLGLGANLHFEKPSDNVYNSELRIGFTMNGINLYSNYFHKEDAIRVDTLRSTNTGKEYYVDSIVENTYFMNYRQDQFYFNMDYTIGSLKKNRFRYYIGAGLGIGYSFNAYTDITYYTNTRLETSIQEVNNFQFDEFRVQSERLKNKNAFSARVYVPIGLDLKLSKTNENWNKAHIFFEASPSVSYSVIPELDSKTYFAFYNAIGFRYDFK